MYVHSLLINHIKRYWLSKLDVFRIEFLMSDITFQKKCIFYLIIQYNITYFTYFVFRLNINVAVPFYFKFVGTNTESCE